MPRLLMMAVRQHVPQQIAKLQSITTLGMLFRTAQAIAATPRLPTSLWVTDCSATQLGRRALPLLSLVTQMGI